MTHVLSRIYWSFIKLQNTGFPTHAETGVLKIVKCFLNMTERKGWMIVMTDDLDHHVLFIIALFSPLSCPLCLLNLHNELRVTFDTTWNTASLYCTLWSRLNSFMLRLLIFNFIASCVNMKRRKVLRIYIYTSQGCCMAIRQSEWSRLLKQ
jgi:hypothetical protein